MIRALFIFAFVISVAAFCCGAVMLFRRGKPGYFQLYVCAAGCYMLEELWVVVNSLLGNGAQDGLVTVRLFGLFGCLCFMLSANANEYDRVVDENKNIKARILGLAAPAVLLALYAPYAFAPENPMSPLQIVLGLISLSPALPTAYFCLKHLLLPEDAMGFLRVTRSIEIVTLVFCAVNFAYPILDLIFPADMLSVYNAFLAVMLFVLVILCARRAVKWKTLI